MWNWISSNVKLDLFQCEIGFCSNVKFDLFRCQIGFVPVWNWICSIVKLDLFKCKWDFFKCKIGFVSLWNEISFNLKWDLFQCEIGFFLIWNWFFLMWNWIFSAEKKLQFNYKKCKYIKVGKNRNYNPSQTLEVDTCDIKYDDEDNLIESEGAKRTMEEVTELKYLGFVISSDASNVANISAKQNKSYSTIRSITNIIKGLKTSTVQNGLIYLNSLLRSSIVYGGETIWQKDNLGW